MLTDVVNTTIRDSFIQQKTITVTCNRETEKLTPLRLTDAGDGSLTLIAETARGTVKPINTKEITTVIINQNETVPEHVQNSDLYQESKCLEHKTLDTLPYQELPVRKQEQVDTNIAVTAFEQFAPVSGKALEPIPLAGERQTSESLKHILTVSGVAVVIVTVLNFAGFLLLR